MSEEQVTKAILKWLLDNRWEIVCFDFPQSGTGRLLHQNSRLEKNKGAINPDIVAVREGVCLLFENKNRFYLPDYRKIHDLIVNNDYGDSIAQLLADYTADMLYYGIGLPTEKHGKGSREATCLVDFIVGVNVDKSITILHDPKSLFLENK